MTLRCRPRLYLCLFKGAGRDGLLAFTAQKQRDVVRARTQARDTVAAARIRDGFSPSLSRSRRLSAYTNA